MKSFRIPVLTGMLIMAGVLTGCGGSSSSDDDASSGAASSSSSSSSSSAASASLDTVVPANGETSAYADTTLQITFDSAPTIGDSGFIYVYKADGTLVDKISPNVFSTGSWVSDATAEEAGLTADTLSAYNTQSYVDSSNTEVNQLGSNVSTIQSSGEELYRWVLYRPITISDNVATIKLHDGKLEAGTTYYVTMDSGVLDGTIDGLTFNGISSTDEWTFTTKANPDPDETVDITVAASGTAADFRTVQGALDWMMQNCAGTATYACNSSSVAKTITIADGTYDELLWMRGVKNLTISGTTRDGTVVQAENFESFNPGTGSSATPTKMATYLATAKTEGDGYRPYLGGGRAVLLAESTDQFKLTKMTLKNTHVKASNYNNQAETMYFNSGSGRFIGTYMNFLSAQDTIQVKGYSWFYKDLIAGDVDFIWGAPYASLYEDSEIRTVADPTNTASGGYIVQARAYYGYPGFVFLNSTLTAESDVPSGATYLARSGGKSCTASGSADATTEFVVGSALYCDIVTYVNTTMGSNIADAGWYIDPVPNLSPALNTTEYEAIGSTGVYAAQGWFEYNSVDTSGSPISHSASNYFRTLGSEYYTSSYSSRDQIFQSYSSNTGWSPTETSCTDDDSSCLTTQ